MVGHRFPDSWHILYIKSGWSIYPLIWGVYYEAVIPSVSLKVIRKLKKLKMHRFSYLSFLVTISLLDSYFTSYFWPWNLFRITIFFLVSEFSEFYRYILYIYIYYIYVNILYIYYICYIIYYINSWVYIHTWHESNFLLQYLMLVGYNTYSVRATTLNETIFFVENTCRIEMFLNLNVKNMRVSHHSEKSLYCDK